ncbi:hypothetical protein Gpo141_00011311 [Globisporangium polare]
MFVYTFDLASAAARSASQTTRRRVPARCQAQISISQVDVSGIKSLNANCSSTPTEYQWHIHVEVGRQLTEHVGFCEKGDLSGKLGSLKGDATTQRVTDTKVDEHFPLASETSPQWNIVLHPVCAQRKKVEDATGAEAVDGGCSAWCWLPHGERGVNSRPC